MSIKVIHHGDESHLLYIARVSSNQDNTDPRLLGYLVRNGHWSPFEMIGACVEINTTRDIGRQILRHRSFAFQEFSQRYAEVTDMDTLPPREMRLKATQGNRQGSQPRQALGKTISAENIAEALAADTFEVYHTLVRDGVAPECARAVLPEGYTPTRLYMNGTLRSWVHYLRERLHFDPKTGHRVAQDEHVKIATLIYDALVDVFPATFAALADISYIQRDKPLPAPAGGAVELLRRAADLFRWYGTLHAAKGTPDGATKALRNNDMADDIERFLTRTPT